MPTSKRILLASFVSLVVLFVVGCNSKNATPVSAPANADSKTESAAAKSAEPTPARTARQHQVAAETTGCHARAHGRLPDRHCTPGAVDRGVTQAGIASTICKSGWTDTVRPDESYTNAVKIRQITRYHYARTDPSLYEEDHLIPLELGGSPSSPRNLWPEYDRGHIPNPKDAVENALKAAVCAGRVSLRAAQHAIAVNWIRAESRLGISSGGGSAPAPSPPPTTAAPTGCHPKTSSGNCYEAGEFCRASDVGTTGVAGNGERIVCRRDGSYNRWEPA